MISIRTLRAAAALCLACAPLFGQQPTSRPMGWTGVLDEDEFAALHELKEGATPKLYGEDIAFGDAKTKGYLSLPKGRKPTAGIVVIHEWWGLNDHIKHWADRLAADGYAALAVDLYGGTVATTRDGALAAMRKANEDPDALLKILLSGHRFLAADPRIKATKRACIGWCFGGGWSLRLAMAADDLDAAVVYYGRLVDDPAKLAGIGAPMLGVFGNQDQGIPPAAVDGFAAAMKKAGKKLELHRYDANHAFANPSSARYDQKNAAAAWQQVRAFLKSNLAAKEQAGGSFDMGGRTVRYTVPDGWRPAKVGGMRKASFGVGDGAECYVVVLGGSGGGLGPNVNRWRQQMGQEPLSDAGIAALPSMQVLGKASPWVRIEGGERTMLGAVCPLDGQTLFVKMTGPAAVMADQEAHFKAFCGSLR